MKIQKSAIFFGLISLLTTGLFCAHHKEKEGPKQQEAEDQEAALALARENRWVDSVWASLDENQRIGQVFMVAAYPKFGAKDQSRVEAALRDYHVGGLIFFQGQPYELARLSNHYQRKSRTPLLYGIDAEWGLNMRIDSTVAYPRQMLLGAIQDLRWIYLFGRQVGRELKRVGIHINFAPVVDINSNPKNPVIGDRSFGEDRDEVIRRAFQYARGLEDEGVMACAKHFPGHGDTDADSHYDLPLLLHGRERLDSLELFPFKALRRLGLSSIMVGHLEVPSLESRAKIPATLSQSMIKNLLVEELGFEGLIITDALNMAGATKHYAHGETDFRALEAGNDILLMTQDLEAARQKIKAGLRDGRLSWEDLEFRVRKILRAKYRHGLANYQAVAEQNVAQDLNKGKALWLKAELSAAALTLAKYDGQSLPLNPSKKRLASLSLNSGSKTYFQEVLSDLGLKEHYQLPQEISPALAKKQLEALAQYEVVVVSARLLSRKPLDNYNLSASSLSFVQALSKRTKVVLVCFGIPYAMKDLTEVDNLIFAYEESKASQEVLARALMGWGAFKGRLPVSVSRDLVCGSGLDLEPERPVQWAIRPEALGLDGQVLAQMDKIAAEMIKEKAAPGAQVLVLRRGQIAWHRCYGHHDYSKKRATSYDDVYDLASVSKIAATTLALMHLYEQGQIDFNQTLGHYLPELRGSNKADLILGEVLAHQAGLKAWIPFYTESLDEKKKPDTKYYRNKALGSFQVPIAEQLFLDSNALDSLVWQRIYQSKLNEKKDYVYSDLGLILAARIIERLTGKSLDNFVQERFYGPMGLERIGFNPRQKAWPLEQLVPTEEDDYFRYQTIKGHVHDMAAAMLGGVAGHAGLFAQGRDLAAVMLLLGNGTHGTEQYFKPQTLEKFTSAYNPAVPRRGLGFDRKDPDEQGRAKNVPQQASDQIFGHLGFTGIAAWYDPDKDLGFIFLSNRTYPDAKNMKLVKKDIRKRMHEICYQALLD